MMKCCTSFYLSVVNWGQGLARDLKTMQYTHFIILTIAFTQGILALADLAVNYLLKDDLGVGPAYAASLLSIISIPWIVKPLWGFISDLCPIFGLRRKPYLIFFSVLNVVCFLYLATGVYGLALCIVVLLVNQVGVAFCNVLGEALMVEMSQLKEKEHEHLALPHQEHHDEDHDHQEEPHELHENKEIVKDDASEEVHHDTKASNNVSLFFGFRNLGFFLTSYLGGRLLESMDKRNLFFITGFFPLLLLVTVPFLKEQKFVRNDKEEEIQSLVHNPAERHNTPPPDRFNSQLPEPVNHLAESKPFSDIDEKGIPEIKPRPTSTAAEIGKNTKENMKLLYEFVKKPEIFKPIVILFLFLVSPSSQTVMFYYYTNHLNFEPSFMGSLRVVSALFSTLAIWVYNKWLSKYHFKTIFTWSTIVAVLLSLLQLILIFRINVSWGISDKLFCFGDSIILNLVGELNLMPFLVLACQICPKKIEGTMYALLMSVLNLASMVSSQLGALVTELLGLSEDNFDNLWLMIIITNVAMLFPLLFLRHLNIDSAIKQAKEENARISHEGNEQEQEIAGPLAGAPRAELVMTEVAAHPPAGHVLQPIA